MPPALDVAEYLVRLASPGSAEDRDPICNLRLQKLLYYIQGWTLAARGDKLFNGRIEAWTYGPVVKEVYPVYQRQFDIQPTKSVESLSLTEVDKKLVEWVWERYKGMSATALKDKTHLEAPWLEARGDLLADAPSDREITPESMRAFFLPQYVEYLRRQDPRIDAKLWIASADSFAAGRSRKAQDIYREILDRRTGGHRATDR